MIRLPALESCRRAGAVGEAASVFPDMSKSEPTRLNVPHNNGTCKLFFEDFFG
jgi:hypothetical protein